MSKSNQGQQILEGIIKAGLVHGVCAECETHGVVLVWAANSDEQLEAIVSNPPPPDATKGCHSPEILKEKAQRPEPTPITTKKLAELENADFDIVISELKQLAYGLELQLIEEKRLSENWEAQQPPQAKGPSCAPTGDNEEE